ncbi:MAG: hypothetical protein ACP6KW_07540 [Candidatus Thorarchaeota archaeon]
MPSSRLNAILTVLKQSKDSGMIHDMTEIDTQVMEQLGLSLHPGAHIDRDCRIRLAMEAVNSGAEISKVVNLLTWKDFEGLVAGVLSEHQYSCLESYRRRGTKFLHGMEIDVVGVRGRTILSIDAKMWGVRNGKTAALKTASKEQKRRTSELAQELEALSKRLGTMRAGEYAVYPLVVTWLVEDVQLFEGVAVVPIFKLNSFILEFDQYEDMLAPAIGYL